MGWTYTTPFGVLYNELQGSPSYDASYDKVTATCLWQIRWSDIDTLLREAFPAAVGYRLYFPGKPFMPVENIRITQFKPELVPTADPFVGHNTYEYALATITFATWKYEEATDQTLREHRVSIGGESIRFPTQVCAWSDSIGTPLQENEIGGLGEIVPTLEHSMTLHHCTTFPKSTIIDKIGQVNDDEDLFDAPDETLLFLGVDASRTISLLNDTFWRCELRFSERRPAGTAATAGETLGWNHFLVGNIDDTDKGKWKRIVKIDNASEGVYKKTTFNDLLTAFYA